MVRKQKVSPFVRQCYPALLELQREVRPRVQRKMLNAKMLRSICEILLNILTGNIRVGEKVLEGQLKPLGKPLMEIMRKRTKTKRKRSLLTAKRKELQGGQILGTVLALGLPILLQLLKK